MKQPVLKQCSHQLPRCLSTVSLPEHSRRLLFFNISSQPHQSYVCNNRFSNQRFIHTSISQPSDKKPIGLTDSILAAKIAESKNKEDDKSESSEGGEGDKKEKKEWPKWKKYTLGFFGLLFTGSTVGNCILFSLPDKDAQGNDVEDEFSSLPFPTQNYRRLKNKIFTTKKAIEEPFSDKLLPDPLEPPYHQPKYTIVLEITGVLVKSDWTHKHGWRFQKRPGLDIFLQQVGYPNYELVIWTSENAMTFFPIVDCMDPSHALINYRLFRDATRFKNGTHVKELCCLNRDLKRVIVIDCNKLATQDNPDNALTLPRWSGDMNDRALFGLAQLLQEINDSDVDDVRDVLHYYKQFDDPIETFR